MRSSPRSQAAATAISETQTPRSHLRGSAARTPRSCSASGRRPVHCGFLICLLPLIAPPSCVMPENLPLMFFQNLFVFMLLCLISKSPMRSAPLRINSRSRELPRRHSAFVPAWRPAARLRPAALDSICGSSRAGAPRPPCVESRQPTRDCAGIQAVMKHTS